MLKTYLKVTFRVLRQNITFSGLNILGLSLGIACSLLILLWVRDERIKDTFHTKRDRMYFLYERSFSPTTVQGDYDLPTPLGAELKRTIPEVEAAVTMDYEDDFTFRANDHTTKAEGGYAGQDFFTLFSFPLLEGNPATALAGPSDISISRSLATQLFGSPHTAMGKNLQRNIGNRWETFRVSAVFEDVPANSSLKFDFEMTLTEFYKENPGWDRWDNSGPWTVILLKPDVNPGLVSTKIRHFLDKYEYEEVPGYHREIGMQRYDSKYLHSNFKDGYLSGGRIEYVRLFSLVAVFILLIACINFMNLTTARSLSRAKEIGVRKVVGAGRGSVIWQFLGEAVVHAILAAIVALLVATLLLPAFNAITGKHITLPVSNALFWLQLAGLIVLTGILSGSYPAFYLSSFGPIVALKGVLRTGRAATLFRKGLVVFQFSLSIILIIATIVVSRQIDYIRHINLGFDRQGLVYVPIEGALIRNYPLFRDEALQLPGIQEVSCMSYQPTFMDNGTSSLSWSGKPANYKPSFTFAAVGYDFTHTVGIHMLAGRDFSPEYPTDTSAFLLNEEAVKTMGILHPADVIGRELQLWDKKGKVIGVMKSFHFSSLHDPIKPLIFFFNQEIGQGSFLVKTKPGQTTEAIASIQQLCRKLNPAFPFTYQFADDEYNKLYKSEQVIGNLSNYFAFLAILISSLGLLGLAIFTAQQRTKEIGIRKVLGAGTTRLLILLAQDFLLLVGLAFLIGAPIASWAVSGWLQDYAYHTPVSATIFVFAGILAFAIAVLTISFHTIKTALANPVKSLRTE